MANVKSIESKAKIVQCLCEGMSIRATARICGCAINTVVKLLTELGPACIDWHSENVVNLPSLVVRVDELWSFVGCKEKQATSEQKAHEKGDCWTWTALDSDSKLMISWNVGPRDPDTCRDFIDDLAYRVSNRIQLSSDGLGLYNNAVKVSFGPNVDYGQVVRTYGLDICAEKRHSPPVCNGCKTKAITGDPMDRLISTSHVDRQNLNIRMGCRRFTRLTNAFSKKAANQTAAVSLYFMFYNFCRPPQTLLNNSAPKGRRAETTPAMAAGLTDHVWTIAEMLSQVQGKSN